MKFLKTSLLVAMLGIVSTPALQAVCYTKSCLLKVIERACQQCKYDLVGDLVCSIDQYDTNTVSAIVDCLGSACVGNECLSQILFQIACKCPDKLKLWICELKQVKSFDELGCVFGQAMENAANAINNPSSAPKNCTGDPLLELIQVALDTTILGWYRCDEQGCPDGAVSDVYTDFGLENLQNFNLLSQSLLCNLKNCLTQAATQVIAAERYKPENMVVPAYKERVSQATWCYVFSPCNNTTQSDAVSRCFAKFVIDNCNNPNVFNPAMDVIGNLCSCPNVAVYQAIADMYAQIIRCGQQQKPCCDWNTILRNLAERFYNEINAVKTTGEYYFVEVIINTITTI